MASPPATTITAFRSIPASQRLYIPTPATARSRPLLIRPPGTAVIAGERLAVEQTETDAAPLAPVAGTIVQACRATLLNGQSVDAVEFQPVAGSVVQNSAKAEVPHRQRALRFTDMGVWIDHLLKAGVNAFRICSPDLIGQMYQCLIRPIDTVLCCVMDSDPNMPLNSAVAEAFPGELAAGIDLLSKLTGAQRAWVVADPLIPNNWYSAMDPLIIADGLELAPLRSDYPQAHPTVLLHTLLERRLRPGRLPVEQGVLLLDACAAVAIGKYVLHGQPMLEVPLAVRDHIRHRTHFLSAPVGMPLENICEFIGIPANDVLLRGGDFLRDQMLAANSVAGPGELVVHVASPEIPSNPDPCVRCAWCIDACPTRIQPAGLLEASQRNDLPLAESFGVEACIECGICSFVCPSRLPLLASIRRLRGSNSVCS
jgi:Na+-translocating ferredoxin:NAD+ oxidoreductase subunit C